MNGGRAAAAVVVPTVLRASLLAAARSVFAQDLGGPIHLLIGVDRPLGARDILDRIAAECPSHVRLTVVDPGYSTSLRHGGLYDAHGGGALRPALSYLADSVHVAYLDDDNTWAPAHLRTLRRAIEGRAWAYSLRWLIDETTGERRFVDCMKSIGPRRGDVRTRGPVLVDTNCLMLDKRKAHGVLPMWAEIGDQPNAREDVRLTDALERAFPDSIGASGLPTVNYLKVIVSMVWLEGVPVVVSPASQALGTLMRAFHGHVPGGSSLAPTDRLPPLAATLIEQAAPQEIAVAGAGAAGAAAALAGEADARGQRPDIAWIDPAAVEIAADRGVAPPSDWPGTWAWPLVQRLPLAARFLAVQGVSLDLVWLTTTLSAARADDTLADWWALLRPGGVLVAAGDDGAGPQVARKRG